MRVCVWGGVVGVRVVRNLKSALYIRHMDEY